MGESFEVQSQQHYRYNSGTSNEELTLPLIKNRADNIEDSFVQFGMDAIRAHLEGKSEGINKAGLSSDSLKKVKRALRFQRNLPIYSSHLLPKSKESPQEEQSFTYGSRQGRVATVMGLRVYQRKEGNTRLKENKEFCSLNTTTIGTMPPPREEVLMLARGVINTTLKKNEEQKNKKASVAKKGVYTLRQSVGVAQEANLFSKKRRASPVAKLYRVENSSFQQHDKSASQLKTHTQCSPAVYPSRKQRGGVSSSSQLGPRRYSSHHATQKHKISAHSILNDESSASMCLQGERRSSTHLGATTDESSNYGVHSDRQPVEPAMPKPTHIPKYRLKMIMKQEKRKQSGIQPNHEVLDLVMNKGKDSKARIFKTRAERVVHNSDSREGISRVPAHSFSSYTQNRATPKLQKKRSPGKYAVYGAINSTLSTAGSKYNWEMKRDKSRPRQSERTIVGGGGTGGAGITIIQTPQLNNINHYNSYNIGHLSFAAEKEH